eukprot:4441679-Alexandrium_andersonii.AAC.1
MRRPCPRRSHSVVPQLLHVALADYNCGMFPRLREFSAMPSASSGCQEGAGAGLFRLQVARGSPGP